MQSDEELVLKYMNSSGSHKQYAFDCLYLRYIDSLTNYFFFSLSRDMEKARDFAHDLFLKILESPEKINPSKPFRPWVFRVASNMCKNEYRRSGVVEKYQEQILRSDHTQAEIDTADIGLNESIKKLNHDQRSLIILRFKINMSIKEMAEICECPEGTVKSRLFYAIKNLSELHKD